MSQVKLFDPFPRAKRTTLQHFSQHWSTVHAGLAADIPQIRHYVQSHRLPEQPDLLGEPLSPPWCDGSSETWYDSADSFREMLGRPDLNRLLLDETNFMDLEAKRNPLLADEHLIDAGRFGPDRPDVKILLFLRRRPELSGPQFVERWLAPTDAPDGRAVGASRHIACTAVSDAYTLSHPDGAVFDGEQRPAYDAVRELWWPNADALTQGCLAAPESWERLMHPAVADLPNCFALLARELIIRP